MDSGVKEAGSAVGGWGAGHLAMCVHVRIALGEGILPAGAGRFCGVRACICPSQLDLQYSTNLSFVFWFLVRN